MKKLFLFVCMILICISGASAATWFNDSFTRANSNTVGNAWVENEGANTYYAIFSNRLQINYSGAGNAIINRTYVGATNGMILWNFTLEAIQTNKQVDLELRETNTRCVDLRTNTTGGLQYINSAVTPVGIQSYTTGHVYAFATKAWPSNDTFDLDIDGTRKVTAGTFRQACTTPNRMYIDAGVAATEKFYVDNVFIGNTTPFPPVNGITIVATNFYTGNAIYPFTVTFTNGTIKTNSTANTLYFNFTSGTYTFRTNASGYISNTTTITFINRTTIAMRLIPNNRISILFRNEENRSIIRKVNYELQSTYLYGNFTTFNGTVTINGLSQGRLRIRYTGYSNSTFRNPFNTRNYYFFVPISNNAFTNVTLYLANISKTDYYLPIVLDTYQKVIDDSYLQVLRYYSATNTYEPIEMQEVDITGVAPVNIFFNTVAYKFRVYVNQTLRYETPSEKYIFDQSNSINVPSVSGFVTGCSMNNPVYGSITNTSTAWSFAYSSSGSLNTTCLTVTKISGLNTIINKSCSIGTAATITIPMNISQSGMYTAIGTAMTLDGQVCIVTTKNFIVTANDNTSIFKEFGVFLMILSLVVTFTLLIDSIFLALLVAALEIIAFITLGIIYVQIYVIISFIVLTIIIWTRLVKR